MNAVFTVFAPSMCKLGSVDFLGLASLLSIAARDFRTMIYAWQG